MTPLRRSEPEPQPLVRPAAAATSGRHEDADLMKELDKEDPIVKPAAAAKAKPAKAPAPKKCGNCGAMPMMATRDGLHTCQCRSEAVSK